MTVENLKFDINELLAKLEAGISLNQEESEFLREHHDGDSVSALNVPDGIDVDAGGRMQGFHTYPDMCEA